MKILLPLDGSQLSEKAIPFATALASRYQGQVLVVRAVNPIVAGMGMGMGMGGANVATSLFENEDALADAYLSRIVQDWPEASPLKLAGSPREALSRAATDEHCNLVIMSSSGRSGTSRWLLGSVAEATLRHAPCPVLLVRGAVALDSSGLFRNVLVPCDGSAHSCAVLQHVRPYLADEAKVTMLRASGMHTADYQGLIDPKARLDYLESLGDDLLKHKLEGYDVAYSVLDGEPVETILRFAEDKGCDLIAMSTHGYRGFARLFLGSVAERVARHAPCCVLALRQPDEE